MVENKFNWYKLEIYIPKTHLDKLKDILLEVDAGHVGQYRGCLSYSKVNGMWIPLDSAKPYLGEVEKPSNEIEYKVEVAVKSQNLDKTINAIRIVHPYETPIIYVIPLMWDKEYQ